jgi:hypothetical protein
MQNTPTGTVSVVPSMYLSVWVTVSSPPGVERRSYNDCSGGHVRDRMRRDWAVTSTVTVDPDSNGTLVVTFVNGFRYTTVE